MQSRAIATVLHSFGLCLSYRLTQLMLWKKSARARVSENADRAIIESWTSDIILPFAHFKEATQLLSIFRATVTISLLSYQETKNIQTFDSVATANICRFVYELM